MCCMTIRAPEFLILLTGPDVLFNQRTNFERNLKKKSSIFAYSCLVQLDNLDAAQYNVLSLILAIFPSSGETLLWNR